MRVIASDGYAHVIKIQGSVKLVGNGVRMDTSHRGRAARLEEESVGLVAQEAVLVPAQGSR